MVQLKRRLDSVQMSDGTISYTDSEVALTALGIHTRNTIRRAGGIREAQRVSGLGRAHQMVLSNIELDEYVDGLELFEWLSAETDAWVILDDLRRKGYIKVRAKR